LKTILLAFFFALLAVAQTSTVMILDSSRSFASASERAKAEQRLLLDRLTDGSHFVLLSVGGSVRRLFDGPLNPARRAEAVRQLAAVTNTAVNTDLAAALDDARASLSGLTGRRMIWIYTDGGNAPPPGSRFRGKPFSEVLRAFALGQDAELFIRQFGGASLERDLAGIRNVTVLRAEPDWLRIFPPPSPRKTPAPVERNHYLAWGLAALTVMIVAGCGGWWAYRRLPRGLTEAPGPLPTAPAQRPTAMYNLHVAGGGSSRIGEEGTTRIVVGESHLADLYLSGIDGACVAVWIDETGNPIVENVGRAPVAVGARRLSTGQRLKLPRSHVQMRLGNRDLHVYPATRALAEEVTR
jgi:hypothetical protein